MIITNFLKRRDDIHKCIKVIDSCVTIEQLFSAHNMIDSFGKKYKFDSVWYALDAKAYKAEYKKITTDKDLKQKLTEWTKGY